MDIQDDIVLRVAKQRTATASITHPLDHQPIELDRPRIELGTSSKFMMKTAEPGATLRTRASQAAGLAWRGRLSFRRHLSCIRRINVVHPPVHPSPFAFAFTPSSRLVPLFACARRPPVHQAIRHGQGWLATGGGAGTSHSHAGSCHEVPSSSSTGTG